MEVLLRPKTVALIGASNDAGKVSGRPLAFLKANNTGARIFPVNPNRSEVQGVPAFASLSEIPERIEHAYILLSSDAAVDAVAECAAAGVRVVTVLADGFAEAGVKGQARQKRLLEIANTSGIRVVGPNSMGVANPGNGFICTTNAAFANDDLAPGRYGVLSQSGSIIGTLLSRGAVRGVFYSFFVSLGNEADLDLGEIGQVLVDDENTDAFVLFMETIRNPEAIAAFAKAAHERGKPIIVYKLGRSALSEELAVSHTGAIVGSDAAADCFFRHHGIQRVDLFETLFELPGLLISSMSAMAERPKSATVVTTTGGGGAMIVDRLGALGIDVVGVSEQARAKVSGDGIDLTDSRLVDVTLAGTNYDTMKTVLKALIEDPASGIIVVAVGSSAQFFPELAVHPIVDAVKEIGPGGAPVIGFPVPDAPEAIRLLSREGIAAARTAESCAEAVARCLHQAHPVSTPKFEPVAGLSQALGEHNRAVLNEVDAGRIIEALGVVRPTQLVLDKSEALPRDIGLNFPVVAKIIADDLPHKTEAGAVTLNICDRISLQAAIGGMLESVARSAPDANIEGILLQEMVAGRAEVMLGVTRDPAVGATITLAAGGTLAEIYADFSMRLAPVDVEQARNMIDEVRGLAIVRGYRNLPRGDTEALAETISSFSRIALETAVQEAEINPLIIGAEGEGCFAVDGLIRLGDPLSKQAPPG